MQAVMLAGLVVLSMVSATTDRASSLLSAGKGPDAFRLIEAKAAEGEGDALDYLAWFHDEGRETAQDHQKAAILYRRAAELGIPHARWRLGVMLDEGIGVDPDPTEAVRLFRLAAGQGFSNAYVSLGVMQSAGRGTPMDSVAALDSYRHAARLGNVHAFNEIGVVYANGEGVPQDEQEAMAWFAVAAAHGNQNGARFLAMLADRLGAAAASRAEARANIIAEDYGIKARKRIS